MPNKQILCAAVFFIALPLLSGCGLLLGNVKPIERKAENYQALNLSEVNKDWVRLSRTEFNEVSSTTDDSADLSFQSQRTASIISLNSVCRSGPETEQRDLRAFTQLLLMGITDITGREESEIQVDDTPGLQTTIEGKLSGESMRLRTIVIKRGYCLYDLMYIARPEHFKSQEPDFSRFVVSLRLK